MLLHNAQFDVLILGSGAAGLSAALELTTDSANSQPRVAVVSKSDLEDGSTFWAQGGISAVLDDADSIDAHVQDTLTAGAGLCDPEAVRFTVERGPEAIRWLIEHDVHFDADGKGYHLTREGGHSHRRVVHAADATGRAVHNGLLGRAQQRQQITFLDQCIAVDLVRSDSDAADNEDSVTSNNTAQPPRCIGAYLYDGRQQKVVAVRAKAVVLATGGANKVYLYTSNPDGSTGDGIALASRAGCPVANMEFMQFHPTCLYHPQAKSFLISEALRGEGAKLRLPPEPRKNNSGERFMSRHDERAELAPRDVVARAIDHEMKRLGVDHVELDISHQSAEFIQQHFPNIASRCAEFGFDLSQAPIPVVPAAHYTCGGVITDLNGATDLSCLYAVGETASTGLHGANRMASNSLLECVVFGRAAAAHILQNLADWPNPPTIRRWDESQVTNSDEEVVVSHNWDELRRFMWDYVGIVRTNKRLERARHRCDLLLAEIAEYYGNFHVTPDLLELRNLSQVASLIIDCAQQRRESRGLHYTLDYPELLSEAKPTVLTAAS